MHKLKQAFDAVFDANLMHRKGHHIQQLDDVEVAQWLSDEAGELATSIECADPDIDEAGDVLVLLVHLARLCNWTFDDIEKAAIRKLRLRHGVEGTTDGAFPRIICLCGSTRFMDVFFEAGWAETLKGNIVLSVGVCKHTGADGAHGGEALGQDVADALDELHLRKIDMADEVYILNVGGYIGESTQRELDYAQAKGKPVRFLED